MSQSFSLIVSIPSQDPVRHDLEADKVTLGRSPENDIQILVAEVSVKHAEFVKDGESYNLVDPGSTNGTKVNGQAVGASGKTLAPMDKVLLGETVPAYFVPSAVLESTSIPELVKSIEEESSKGAAQPETAPVAVAAPAQPGAATPSAGASTVKLDQVRPPAAGTGPAKPPSSPAAPKPPTAAPGSKPPAVVAPKAAPESPAAPSPGATPAPPKPAGGPQAPQPVSPTPLRRPPAEGEAPAAPAKKAPSIPLPKTPEKEDED
ncbi:MAG: FHA domain-containing protein [Verrucomicrobiales bacterium]